MGNFAFGGDEEDEGFFFSGGHPGARKRGAPEKVDNTRFYTLLGVEPGASDEDIRKSYKKLVMKYHPDRGGDPETFKEISVAYEVLSDPDKRAFYDKHGEEGLKKGGADQGGPEDLFSTLFGFGGGGGGHTRQRKCKDTTCKVTCSLEDMYTGSTAQVSIKRMRTCSGCEGRGTNQENQKKPCRACNGQGIKMVVRQLGRGMVEQMQVECDKCEGSGDFVRAKDKCRLCKGETVVKEENQIEINIEKGMRNNEKIVLEGQGNQIPGAQAGDVIVLLEEMKHSGFERNKDDLMITKTISLQEALCGCSLEVAHLDGRKIHITSEKGHVIKPGDVKVVTGEGMPRKVNPHLKGNLYVKFAVEFPSSLTPEQTALITQLFPLPKPASTASGTEMNTEDKDEAILQKADLSEFGKSDGTSSNAYDEDNSDDEEEGGAPGGVQCKQM